MIRCEEIVIDDSVAKPFATNECDRTTLFEVLRCAVRPYTDFRCTSHGSQYYGITLVK